MAVVAGCGQSEYVPVSFRPGSPSPTRETASVSPVRVGMAPILSSHAGAQALARMCALLAKDLHRPVKPFFGRSYQEINQMVLLDQLDCAAVCTGAFATPAFRARVSVLLVPLVPPQGACYEANILVQKDAPYQDFRDLKGRRMAFTDPLSLTGYFYPVSRACGLGRDAAAFFGSTLFTESHDRSIALLVNGRVDAVSVDGAVWHLWKTEHPAEAASLRVLESSPPYPSPPIVVSTTLPPPLREALLRAFLALTETEEGRSVLASMGWTGFVRPDPGYLEKLDRTAAILGKLRENPSLQP